MKEINFKLPEFNEEGADSRAPYSTRRDVLESSKLSRLPQRKPFTLEGITFPKSKIVCVNNRFRSLQKAEPEKFEHTAL